MLAPVLAIMATAAAAGPQPVSVLWTEANRALLAGTTIQVEGWLHCEARSCRLAQGPGRTGPWLGLAAVPMIEGEIRQASGRSVVLEGALADDCETGMLCLDRGGWQFRPSRIVAVRAENE